jgi:hypothetical protein
MAKAKEHNWRKYREWADSEDKKSEATILNEDSAFENIELSEEQINEVGKFQVSSNPFKAWQEHGDHNNKLYNDAHWAMKAIPHKKKEIKEIQQLSSKLKNLIEIVQGQAMDL